ncbi:hypothetical protein [Embleya sp. AB8]|uniref:hypothetical protein n=1 Tax=Embleya sp. AB8 TaxID=3156304 RepID=UPI003C74797C
MTSEDPAFDYRRACVDGFEVYEGTALDVRVVVAGLPRAVKDGFLLGEAPRGRFSHAYGSGQDVPGHLELIRSADATAARRACSVLWNSVCHQGTTGSVAPLAVPFLLRIAANRLGHEPTNALGLVAAAACRNHWGDGSHAALLRVADPCECVVWCGRGGCQRFRFRFLLVGLGFVGLIAGFIAVMV